MEAEVAGSSSFTIIDDLLCLNTRTLAYSMLLFVGSSHSLCCLLKVETDGFWLLSSFAGIFAPPPLRAKQDCDNGSAHFHPLVFFSFHESTFFRKTTLLTQDQGPPVE
eukprot:scaffold11302_cov256-Chaetoceros_neogracile.AAC.2